MFFRIEEMRAPDGMAGPWQAYAGPTSQPVAPQPQPGDSAQPAAPPDQGPWQAYAPAPPATAPGNASGPASAPAMDATGYPLVQDALSSSPAASSTFSSAPAAQASEGILGRADDAVRTVFNAATFGVGKNISAAEDALEQPIFRAGSDASSFGQRYTDNLASEKARLAAMSPYESVPLSVLGTGAAIASGAPEAIGRGVLAGARMIPGANALLDAGSAAVQPVANLLGRVPLAAPALKASATGAAYGAAQGAGDTDGGLAARAKGALQGAEVGAIAGPIIEGAGNLVGRGISAAGEALGLGGKAPILDVDGRPILGTDQQPVVATPAVARAAGQQIAGAASDLPAVQASLTQPSELVPGSMPTTFQATGDTGLGQKELQLRNTPSAPGAPGPAVAFLDRANQQNAARVGAIANTAPADASSADLVNGLDAQRQTLAAQWQAAADQAKQGTLQGVGGASDSTPSQAGADLRGAVDQARAPYIQEADQALQVGQQQAAAATEALGGAPAGEAGTAAQQLGQALRAPLAAGDQAAKANVTRLADAIDPDGNLGVDMTPIRDQANTILKGIGPNAAQPTGAEASILNIASQLPNVQSFRDLADLRQQITDTIRGARPNPERAQEVRRLSMLLDGVHDAMAGAANTADIAPAAAMPTSLAATAPNVGSDVFTPSGQRVGVKYEVANAPDLITSHNSDMTPNPAFPAELQPRARGRAASEVQVANIASRLQPERLGASSTVSDGAPIVGPDGIVESGNGRVLALRRAYDANGPQAQSYRDWLASQGHDTGGLDQPVLIRRRTMPMTPEQRVAFAGEGSTPTTLALSSTERAAGDARRLRDDVLHQMQAGDVTDPANRDFVRGFLRNVVEPGQEGSFVTANGALSQEGASRVRAALVQRAYGNDGLSAALAESTDPHAKVLAGAMQDAAGRMARLKAGIEAGDVDPKVDLAPSLVEAAQAVQQARQRGISLADAVEQRDAFSQMSPQAERLLRAAYGPNLSGRMSQGDFADLLTNYAKRAGEQSTAPSLFGPNLTADQLLEGVEARYGKTAGGGQSSSAASARGSFGEAWRNQGRPIDGAGGQAAPGGSGSQRGEAATRILQQAPSSLRANFDGAAADRYAAMRGAHADRKATFGPRAPGVGAVLKSGPTAGTFALPDSSVGPAIFAKGAGAAERVQAALRAGLTPAQIGEYAAYDLRRVATTPDGIIDPKAAVKWRQQHAEAFQALAQADPRIARQFDSAQQMGARLFHLQTLRTALDATHPLKPGWGDAEVMARVWKLGPAGADSVRAVTAGARGSPVAASSIADYAAYSLRKAAAPDGVLDPAKYQAWLKTYDGALSARPDIRAQFASVAAAQSRLDASAAQHAQALKDFQASAAKHFLGGADPARQVGSILSSASSVAGMRDLARLTASDPAARAGIQRAIVDHIFDRFQGNAVAGRTGTEKLKSDQFQTFLSRAEPALREVMSKAQVDGLLAVGADLQRANQSVDGVRVAGGSDTTQRAALMGQAAKGSLVGAVKGKVLSVSLTLAGYLHGGEIGAFLGHKSASLISNMKTAGITQADGLVKEAMLNPGLARVLLSRVTDANKHNVVSAFAAQIGRIAAARGAHAVDTLSSGGQ